MREIELRPFRETDKDLLETWRKDFDNSHQGDVVLDLPHGYSMQGVETIVAEREGLPLASLTGTLAVVLDPLLIDKEATKSNLMVATFMLARTLEYVGSKFGAVDAFIAVSDKMPEFQKIVEQCGYAPTAEGCKIYRIALKPAIITDEVKL